MSRARRAVASAVASALVLTSPGLGGYEAFAQVVRPESAPPLPAAALPGPSEGALPLDASVAFPDPLSRAPLSESLTAPEALPRLGRRLEKAPPEGRGELLRGAFDRSLPRPGAEAALELDPSEASLAGLAAAPESPADLGLPLSDREAVAVLTSEVHRSAASDFPEYGFSVRDYYAWARFIRFFAPSMGISEALRRGAQYVYGDRLETETQHRDFDGSLGRALSALKLSSKDLGKDAKKAEELRKVAEPTHAELSADDASPFRVPVAELVPKKEHVDLVLTAGTLRRLEAAYQAFALRDYMLMTGPPATVKSAIVKYLAAEYAIPHLAVNMHPGIGTFELVGGYRPRDLRITDLGDAAKLASEALEASEASAASPALLESARKVYGEEPLEGLLAKVQADLEAAGGGEPSRERARRLLTLAHGLAFGSNSLVWADGYLTYALKRDIWITFEELNAAPTEVLEFLNEFLRSRRLVITQKMGEAEILGPKAGGRFMLWATKNDDHDSNRNVLSETLTSRWRVKAFGPLPALEQAEILEKRFGLPTMWAVALVQNFHEELQRQAEARQIGADWRDGYSISLRHLLKVARRWKHFVDRERELGGAEPDKGRKRFLLAREAYSVYAGMMRRQDERDGCFKMLDQALKLHDAGITQASLTEAPRVIEDLGDRIRIGDVELLKGKGGPFVPRPNPDYLADEVVVGRLYEYAKSLALGEPLLLMGMKAAGKTSDLEYLFYRLNRNLRYKNLDSDTAIEDVVGGPVKKNGVHLFEEGMLPAAMDEGTGMFLDELNLNPLVEWLNTVSDDGRLYLPHRVVTAADGFALVAAANPPDPRYEGRILLSPAARGRMTERWVDLDESPTRLSRLMDHWLRGGTIYSAILLWAPLALLAGRGLGFGPAGWWARLRDWWRGRASAGRGRLRGTGGGELARPESLDELLKRKGVPEKDWAGLRAKVERIQTILRMVGSSVGRDSSLRFEPGYLWAFFPDLNTITYPFEHLLTHSEDEIVGLSDHEGSHREWTRLDERFPIVRKYLEDPYKMLLANAVEDPRVNNGTIRRLPGSERYFRSTYDRYLPEDLAYDARQLARREEKGPEAALELEGDGASAFNPAALRFPHIEYLMASNYYWRHGKGPPKWNNPSAKEAFEKSRAAFDEIFRMLPPSHDAPEQAKLESQLQALEAIDAHLLPFYEPLVKESEAMLRGRLGKRGASRENGSGKKDAGQRRAEEMLRGHARKAAELLGSKLKTNPRKREVPPEALGPLPSGPSEEGTKPGGGDADPSALTIRDIAKNQLENALSAPHQGFAGMYRTVASVGNQMVTHLENVFLRNSRPRDVGWWRKGKRPDLKRVMRREGEGSEKDDYWLRRTQKTKRRYKVTVLVDESGSMQGYREEALRGVVLFVESLSRLQIDVEVIGFGDKAFVHKAFGRPLTPAEKERLFDELHRHIGEGGSTHDADALQLAVERSEKQEADRRLVFVLTDGQGNGPSKLSAVFPRAASSGIRVIGVGIGAGMAYVKQAYPHHVQVQRIEDLPIRLRQSLEEYIRLEEAAAARGRALLFGPGAWPTGPPEGPHPAVFERLLALGAIAFVAAAGFGAAAAVWAHGPVGFATSVAGAWAAVLLGIRLREREAAAFPLYVAGTALALGAAWPGLVGLLFPDAHAALALYFGAAAWIIGTLAGAKESSLLRGEPDRASEAGLPSIPAGRLREESEGQLERAHRRLAAGPGATLMERSIASAIREAAGTLEAALSGGDEGEIAFAATRLKRTLDDWALERDEKGTPLHAAPNSSGGRAPLGLRIRFQLKQPWVIGIALAAALELPIFALSGWAVRSELPWAWLALLASVVALPTALRTKGGENGGLYFLAVVSAAMALASWWRLGWPSAVWIVVSTAVGLIETPRVARWTGSLSRPAAASIAGSMPSDPSPRQADWLVRLSGFARDREAVAEEMAADPAEAAGMENAVRAWAEEEPVEAAGRLLVGLLGRWGKRDWLRHIVEIRSPAKDYAKRELERFKEVDRLADRARELERRAAGFDDAAWERLAALARALLESGEGDTFFERARRRSLREAVSDVESALSSGDREAAALAAERARNLLGGQVPSS